MLNFLPKPLVGVIASFLLSLNIFFWCSILFIVALIKLALSFKSLRILIDHLLNGIAANWISCNSGWMRLTQKTRWDEAATVVEPAADERKRFVRIHGLLQRALDAVRQLGEGSMVGSGVMWTRASTATGMSSGILDGAVAAAYRPADSALAFGGAS